MGNEVRQILALLNEGKSLGGRHREARETFESAYAKCRALGAESVHALWLCAVAADFEGEYPIDMSHITRAVRLDPLSTDVIASATIIAEHLRSMLTDPQRSVGAKDTPAIYGLLVEAGEAIRRLTWQWHDTLPSAVNRPELLRSSSLP